MTIEEKIKELKRLQKELLMHIVGTSYYMHEALEINKEIKKLEMVKDVKTRTNR